MLKVIVVGLGIIGAEHLRAVKMSKMLELVAVCDINELKAKAVGAEYGVPYFTDYTEMPGKVEADAVILNLPHGLHCESAVFFLDAGMHVFLEKPMANTAEECDRIIEAEKRSGKRVAIGHIQRYFVVNRIIKDYISSGKLGRLFAVNELRSINYFSPGRPSWFFSKKMAGGGIVMNYGAHFLDKLLFITGEHIEDVYSSCGNFLRGEEIEGHAQFLVKMSGGISATVTFSGYSGVGYETTYIGTGGAISVTGNLVRVCHSGAWEVLCNGNDGQYILRELEDFVRFVGGEKNEMPDVLYGKEIIEGIEKIYG